MIGLENKQYYYVSLQLISIDCLEESLLNVKVRSLNNAVCARIVAQYVNVHDVVLFEGV